MKKSIALAICLLMAALLSQVSPACAEEPVATVSSAKQGAWAVRNGKKTVLQQQAPVYVKDALETDNSGKLELKFKDGTIIAMNPATQANVSDFVMSDTKNSFGASVTKGVARVITGALVKRNPIGFKVNTPRSTVGIRGTEVMFIVQDNSELISVMHMSSEYVSVIDIIRAQLFKLATANQTIVMKLNQPAQVINNSPKLSSLLSSLSQSGTVLTVQTLNDLFDAAANSQVITTGSLTTAQQTATSPSPASNTAPAALNDAIVLERGSENNRNTNNDKTVNTSPAPATRCN